MNLQNKLTFFRLLNSYIQQTVSGIPPLYLTNALEKPLVSLKAFGNASFVNETYLDTVTAEGKCSQASTPAPTSPVDIVCNNGVIKVSPNLYNKTTSVIYGYPTSDCTWYARTDNTAELSIVIKLNEGSTYTATRAADSGSAFRIQASDTATLTNGQTLQDIDSTGTVTVNTKTFTVPAGYPYVIFYVRNTAVSSSLSVDDVINAFHVELGSVAADYMPYGQVYTNGTQETITDANGNVATCEMLLKFDTFVDTQEILSGTVNHNSNVLVLDGTENWTRANPVTGGTYYTFNLNFSPAGAGNTCPLCSHLQQASQSGRGNIPDNGIGYSINNYTTLWIRCDTYTTAEQWKQYLAQQYAAGTPVIVAYPLSTTTVESATPQNLVKAPVTATGSLSDLVVTAVSSAHTAPKPTQPLDITCNNGVLKLSPNMFNVSGITFEGVRYTYTLTDNGFIAVAGNNTNSSSRISMWLPVSWFKENTTYYLEGVQNTHFAVGKSAAGTTTNYAYYKALNGTKSFTITTIDPDQTHVNIFVYFGQKEQGTTFTCKEIMLTEGNTAVPYSPYNGTYTEGTQETVGIIGKNLFDAVFPDINTSIQYRHIYLGAGTYTCSTSDFTYGQGTTAYVFFMPGKKTSGAGNTTNGVWQSTPRTATAVNGYVTVAYRLGSGGGSSDPRTKHWQIERSSSPTTYEDYHCSTTATAEDLLSIGSTYVDQHDIINGNVGKNVGILVLDGVTSGRKCTTWNDTYKRSSFAVSGMKSTASNKVDAMSTHFVYSNTAYSSPVTPCFCTNNGTAYLCFIGVQGITSAETANTWLAAQYAAGKPVILVYPLATSTTETVTPQLLSTSKGDNAVIITQAAVENTLQLETTYIQKA